MDSFEAVIASILQRQGYWTMTSVKVELTKAEKRAIGRHSTPRWELDVVAYQGRNNELRIVECKSFLDSPGVDYAAFDGRNPAAAKRYKLFCDATLRRVVLGRLVRQLRVLGFRASSGVSRASVYISAPRRTGEGAPVPFPEGIGVNAEIVYYRTAAQYCMNSALTPQVLLPPLTRAAATRRGRVV